MDHEEVQPQSIVLMGKIASGKETQSQLLVERLGGILHSNGSELRAACDSTTVFGTKLKEMYESGSMMPEWLASYWMTKALISANERPIIFEGVAKKPNEAELFHEIHEWLHRPYIVFHIIVSDEIVRARSRDRARDVLDTDERVERRLAAYHEHTEASIAIFKKMGTLIEVDGERPINDVNADIFAHLEKHA